MSAPAKFGLGLRAPVTPPPRRTSKQHHRDSVTAARAAGLGKAQRVWTDVALVPLKP